MDEVDEMSPVFRGEAVTKTSQEELKDSGYGEQQCSQEALMDLVDICPQLSPHEKEGSRRKLYMGLFPPPSASRKPAEPSLGLARQQLPQNIVIFYENLTETKFHPLIATKTNNNLK